MNRSSIASLEQALAAGTIEPWLATISDVVARAKVQRALAVDRQALRRWPASLGSRLYARLLGEPELASLVTHWSRELDERGTPWVKALRPLAASPGLLLDLAGEDLAPADGTLRYVLEGETIQVECEPRGDAKGRRPRLSSSWGTEPASSREEKQGTTHHSHEFVSDGWGPVSLVRELGRPIELPCPERGSASAFFATVQPWLVVYGSCDEYNGGFVYLLDPHSLEVRHSISTARPVSSCSFCEREDRVLICTYGGLVLWESGALVALSLPCDSGVLSPGGHHLVTESDHGMQVWSVKDLLATPGEPRRPGLPTSFDPSGTRLMSERTLYHGVTGERVAHIEPRLSAYLEGGPGMPWFHCGEQYIISFHNGLMMWETATGKKVPVSSDDRYFHWFCLAYSRDGRRMAALRREGERVLLRSLPSSGEGEQIEIGVVGGVVALSADATKVAVQGDDGIEVRGVTGELLQRWPWTMEGRRHAWMLPPPRFSHDGMLLACACPDGRWQIFSLQHPGQAQSFATSEEIGRLPAFGTPLDPEWELHDGGRPLFVHHGTGTRISMPACGPWHVNPAAPNIVASPSAHLELRIPSRRD